MTGADLRIIRLKLGLLQRTFAAQLGYCEGHYRQIERGHEPFPQRLEKMVVALMMAEEAKKILTTP